MEIALYVVLAMLVPVAIAGPLLGAWWLRADSEWDRVEALVVVAIGVVALGAVAIVAAVLVTAGRAK